MEEEDSEAVLAALEDADAWSDASDDISADEYAQRLTELKEGSVGATLAKYGVYIDEQPARSVEDDDELGGLGDHDEL